MEKFIPTPTISEILKEEFMQHHQVQQLKNNYLIEVLHKKNLHYEWI